MIPDDRRGAGGTILLLQKWAHAAAWESLPVGRQEQIMGRTKGAASNWKIRRTTRRCTAPTRSDMAGVTEGVPDALTRYAHPVTGAYYFVPAAQRLLRQRASE